ncbi:hypothetical protein J2S25_003114 [Mesobacillus stamsii]|uniref:Transposase n=1 Tax=Mesobacillus stamsii TaxID=225347 RepID=A0ABU0FY84_9BACI|nr:MULTISPECIES: IS630 family transposase [Mesobacillus]MDQ0414904.1 hypothetical protein [Mesobacillus stamsii]
MNWTASLLAAWIEKEFQVTYSGRGTNWLLHRLGFSNTRPTYSLAMADPKKQEEFKQEFDQLKKLLHGEIDRIVFEDECMIRDYQAIGRTWFPKGEQKIIPTYGKHEGAKLLATLDYETGDVYFEEHGKYDAEVFLGFLKNFLATYPTGKTVMILDNARIHYAKMIQPFLDENKDKLKFVFLHIVRS